MATKRSELVRLERRVSKISDKRIAKMKAFAQSLAGDVWRLEEHDKTGAGASYDKLYRSIRKTALKLAKCAE